jgi:hypothetical protein
MSNYGEALAALDAFRAKLHEETANEIEDLSGPQPAMAFAAHGTAVSGLSGPLTNVHATGVGLRSKGGQLVPNDFDLRRGLDAVYARSRRSLDSGRGGRAGSRGSAGRLRRGTRHARRPSGFPRPRRINPSQSSALRRLANVGRDYRPATRDASVTAPFGAVGFWNASLYSPQRKRPAISPAIGSRWSGKSLSDAES